LAVSTSWTPSSSADWTTVHVTNITSTYWKENFRYKFRFEGANGNNIFLDDINIYLGSPSDEIILGVAEQGEIAELNLFPNPTEGELNLRFSVNTAQTAIIHITDIYGKKAQIHSVNAAVGSNLVMMDTADLAAGVYFVTIQVGAAQKVMQFIVK